MWHDFTRSSVEPLYSVLDVEWLCRFSSKVSSERH